MMGLTDVNGETTDGGKEDLNIGMSDELHVQSSCVFKQGPSQ